MWGFERQVWNWGVGLSDRVFRFFALSALFDTAIAPITYWVWTTQFGFFLAESVEIDPDSGEFVLEMGRPIFRGTSLLISWDEVDSWNSAMHRKRVVVMTRDSSGNGSSGRRASQLRKGGYGSGSKPASQLKPPPTSAGAGSKASRPAGSGDSGKSSK